MDTKKMMEKIADYKPCKSCKGHGETTRGQICMNCGGSGSILVYR